MPAKRGRKTFGVSKSVRDWREQERQRLVTRLRNNDPHMTTLELPHDAWAYMLAPGGRFVGSEMEDALAHNSVVRALSIELPFGERHLAAASEVRKTLDGLRGCTLPLWLDWSGRTGCDAARVLGGAVPAGAGAGHGEGGARPLQVCGINLRSTELGPEGLEALLALELPHLARLELNLNPLGPACGRLLIDLLERNRQLKLVLDEEQVQHLECYVDSKLVAFCMGFHPRLGALSLVRVLGQVRGSKDECKVYDVPLLRAIEAHVLIPAYRARIEIKRKYINVTVRHCGRLQDQQTGDQAPSSQERDVKFKIKMKTQFGKVFEAFCTRQGIEQHDGRFIFDERIRAEDTPEMLGMEDGDVIEWMRWQVGEIGIFGGHRGGCGVELLKDSKALQHASARDAECIIAALLPSGTPDMTSLVLDSGPVLDSGGRAALMAFIDKLRLAHDPRVGPHFHRFRDFHHMLQLACACASVLIFIVHKNACFILHHVHHYFISPFITSLSSSLSHECRVRVRRRFRHFCIIFILFS